MVYVLSILNTIPFLKFYHSFIFLHWSKNIAPGHFIPLKRLRRHVWEIFLLFSWHLLLCCKAPPKESETSLKGTPGSPIWERFGSAHFASEGLRFSQPSFFVEIWGIEKERTTCHYMLKLFPLVSALFPLDVPFSGLWDIASTISGGFLHHPKFWILKQKSVHPSPTSSFWVSTTIHWLKTDMKSSHHLNVETCGNTPIVWFQWCGNSLLNTMLSLRGCLILRGWDDFPTRLWIFHSGMPKFYPAVSHRLAGDKRIYPMLDSRATWTVLFARA